MAITSKDNEKIKLLRKLKLKKYREQLALFKVENFKIISEAIAGKIEPEQVIVTQDFLDKYKSEFAKFNLDYHLVDKKVYKSFSELETPQGICAVFVKGESKLNFKAEIDVRGQRADEAIQNVTAHIDEALVCEVSTVRVLHGKGNGILRTMLRQMLNTMPHIKSCRDEDIQMGGSGITIVELHT